jgi:hypothetical protein
MRGALALADALVDVRSVDRLAAEFPHVPERILISVLAAYRRTGVGRELAVDLARHRLLDACAPD